MKKKITESLNYQIAALKMASLVLFMLLTFSSVSAQHFPWVIHPTSNQQDEPHAMAVDAQGNMYMGGGFTGTIVFPKDTLHEVSTARTDIFLTKFNTKGEQVWLKQIGGPNYEEIFALSLNNRNELLAAGHFAKKLHFDSTRFAALQSNLGCVQSMGFVAKFDTSGTVKWAVRIDTPNGYVKLGAVKGSLQGGMFVLGNFKGTAVFDNSISLSATEGNFIAYYNTAGVCQWAKLINNFESWSNNLNTDAAGNAYLSCTLNSNRNFMDTTVAGTDNFMLAKFDTIGNVIWSKNLPFRISKSSVSATGNLYGSGMFKGATTIDGITLNTNNTTSNYPVLVTFNSAGICQWAKVIHAGTSFSVAGLKISDQENIYLLGNLNGAFQHQQVQLTNTPLQPGDHNLAALKFDLAGNCVWAHRAGQVQQLSLYTMDVDNQDNIYFAGTFENGSARLGKFLLQPTYSGSGLARNDMFFARLSPPLAATLPQSVCTGSQLLIPVIASDTAGSGSTFYSAGNTFTAQLSDNTGSFSNPVFLGSISSSVSDTISATIPANLAAGSGYKVRILASAPELGSESDYQLELNQTPQVTLASLPAANSNSPAQTLTGGLPAGGTYSGPGVSNNVFDPMLAGPGNHIITYTVSQNGCTASASSTLQVTSITGLPGNGAVARVLVYPNPFSGELYLEPGQELSQAETLHITVTDLAGRIIMNHQVSIKASENKVALQMAALPVGTYALILKSGNHQVVKKITRL